MSSTNAVSRSAGAAFTGVAALLCVLYVWGFWSWFAPPTLVGLGVALLAAGVFALVTADIWLLADTFGGIRLTAVALGSIIAITMYFYKAWTPSIQSGDGQQVLQDPSIVYYVLVFLMGLIFSIGFSGCVLPMVSSVCPKQLSATSFAVLFSLIQGGINVVFSLVLGNVS